MNQASNLHSVVSFSSIEMSANGLSNWTSKQSEYASSTVTMYDMQPISLQRAADLRPEKKSIKEDRLDDSEISRKVTELVQLSHANRLRVREYVERESTILSSSDFARLMLALEKYTRVSFEDERFYVFLYPSGIVGSVWLFGQEAYTCPRV